MIGTIGGAWTDLFKNIIKTFHLAQRDKIHHRKRLTDFIPILVVGLHQAPELSNYFRVCFRNPTDGFFETRLIKRNIFML